MRYLFLALFLAHFMPTEAAERQLIQITTKSTELVYSISEQNDLFLDYYGMKLEHAENIYNAGTQTNVNAFPAFGVPSTFGSTDLIALPAVRTKHVDGNITLQLKYKSYETKNISDNISITTIKLKDDSYPFYVNLIIKAFKAEDVLEMSTVISHQEKKPVTLYNFSSAFLSLKAQEYWLSSLQGQWGDEAILNEEKLGRGLKILQNLAGNRNTQTENPSFMITLDKNPSEDSGNVIGGSLAYTGNWKLAFQVKQDNQLALTAGINELGSEYELKKGERFETPPLILTYSNHGKGQVTRNFHDYARQYKLLDGHKERKILLNSWEGVYFDFTEEDILQMIDDIANIGGELFVLDDGWFANGKYERNNGKTGLGDWQVSKRKLPHGIDYLIDAAKDKGIDFGIWVEPEMTNTESQLYVDHPEWVLKNPKRTIDKGRGGTQVILDLSNPAVQDFVFNTVNNLIEKHPRLDYIKWDANKNVTNYGSQYLPEDRQSEMFIEYHRGLKSVLERLRAKHPDITIQVCASGGGRVSYGYLPYFQEFWTSDNTDALKRIYMQWGISSFYPAIAMASHVSAAKNHQTGREIPLKFRFDVAMTGRLGMELQPKDMTDEELSFSKSAIEVYKNIRPIVQFGDLYKIISPYKNDHIASMAYVTKDKTEAVFFAFSLNMDNTEVMDFPAFKIKGLDPEKTYRLTEVNLDKKGLFDGTGKSFSGRFLMENGIKLNFRREYTSSVIKLEANNSKQ